MRNNRRPFDQTVTASSGTAYDPAFMLALNDRMRAAMMVGRRIISATEPRDGRVFLWLDDGSMIEVVLHHDR